LKYHQRIKLALWTYLELILAFGIIYFALDQVRPSFSPRLCFFWQSLYFSGVTITTLGYGDIRPVWGLPQFLTIYEVISGFTLIIVSFTVYVSRSNDRREWEREAGRPSRGASRPESNARQFRPR